MSTFFVAPDSRDSILVADMVRSAAARPYQCWVKPFAKVLNGRTVPSHLELVTSEEQAMEKGCYNPLYWLQIQQQVWGQAFASASSKTKTKQRVTR